MPNIMQIAEQATPYLTFTDQNGNQVPGNDIGTVVIFHNPDMSAASGATTALDWHNTEPVSLTPSVLDTAQYSNDTDVPQSQTLSHSYTDTNTFTWTLSEEVQLGVQDKGKANFLFVQAELTLTFNFKMGSTQSWTNTSTQTLTVTFPLNVPPHTIVTASWILDRLNDVTLPFTATYQLVGTIGLDVITTSGDYTWSGSAGQLIAAAIQGGAKDQWTVDGDVATLLIDGTVTADEGVKTQVEVKQQPISGGKAVTRVVPYSVL